MKNPRKGRQIQECSTRRESNPLRQPVIDIRAGKCVYNWARVHGHSTAPPLAGLVFRSELLLLCFGGPGQAPN